VNSHDPIHKTLEASKLGLRWKAAEAKMNHSESVFEAAAKALRRRWFMRDCSVGLAGLAATELLRGEQMAHSAGFFGGEYAGDSNGEKSGPLSHKRPHFPGKVKRVGHMFQDGAPSQLEL
jgi:hypothetical protein